MKKDGLFFRLLTLFLTFLKVGALTFGGGYAMIPIVEHEVSRKKKWISEMEMLDIIAISESTPGPIAVNTATYVGYRVGGILGSIVATFGLALPSFVIIFVISYFYKDFMQIKVIQAAFRGLQAAVVLLLFRAFLTLRKGVKINTITIIAFSIAFIAMILVSVFSTGFRYMSLCLIVGGILLGIVLTKIGKLEGGDKK